MSGKVLSITDGVRACGYVLGGRPLNRELESTWISRSTRKECNSSDWKNFDHVFSDPCLCRSGKLTRETYPPGWLHLHREKYDDNFYRWLMFNLVVKIRRVWNLWKCGWSKQVEEGDCVLTGEWSAKTDIIGNVKHRHTRAALKLLHVFEKHYRTVRMWSKKRDMRVAYR